MIVFTIKKVVVLFIHSFLTDYKKSKNYKFSIKKKMFKINRANYGPNLVVIDVILVIGK